MPDSLKYVVYAHPESDCVFIEPAPVRDYSDGLVEVMGNNLTQDEAEKLKNKILKSWGMAVDKPKQNITKAYRPIKFSDVAGQGVSVRQLGAAISKNVIPPAYLFSGSKGCGKTTCARIFAMSLNCKNRQGVDPCGECESCKAILNGNSDYMIEVDGATKGKVEDARELFASVNFYVPVDAYKVIIIDECHMFTLQAWNASLKTIEEPPPRVLFIFCTTEVSKVIATVKNRCTTIQFPAVADIVIEQVIKNILEKEQVPCEEAAVAKIVKLSGGSIRGAQTILEGFIRLGTVTETDVSAIYQSVDPQTVLAYFNNVLEHNTKGACNIAGGWVKMGVPPSEVINGLLEHCCNMIMDWVITDGTLRQMVKLQKEKIGESRVVQWVDFFYDQLQYIRDYPMKYTLVLNLVTIKLIDSIRVREAGPKKKKEERVAEDGKEAVEAPMPTKAAPAPTPAKANEETFRRYQEALTKIKTVTCGIIQYTHPTGACTTVATSKGMVFDIVLEAANAVSANFFLYTDVEAAITDFPTNMNKYLQNK